MLLAPDEAEQFFNLYRALMFFVNQRLQVLPDTIRDANDFSRLSPEQRLQVRDAFLAETDLIEKFIDENPGDFIVDELEIVKSWHELVAGDFFIFRYLKKYAVFLSSEKPPVAYGVVALTQPFEELVGPYLPVMTKAVLLPFRDKLIYDGLLSNYSVSFGGGIRHSLKETYESAKQRIGIVTSIPFVANPMTTDVPLKKQVKFKTRNPFRGRWRITWMEQWDQDVVDEEVEGYFEIGSNGFGSFQFGLVTGEIDYRMGTREGAPCIEFSWDGNAEMDPAQGRGWASLGGEELHGMLYFHRGDESAFRARKKQPKSERARPR